MTIEETHDLAFDSAYKQHVCSQLSGVKRTVVSMLMEGQNFYQISKELQIDKHQIYAMRDELKLDLSWVYEEAKRQKYIDENRGDLGILANNIGQFTKKMGLADFANIYINDYNPKSRLKHWQHVPLQDRYYQVWQTYPKSRIKAPREHLKTTSVCQYLVKRIVERDYPLQIVYFHLNKDIAVEKIRDIQMMAERNPILAANFNIDQAKNWKDGELRLLDGTTISANGYNSGSVGKHPHIIVLDDVIDQEVIYSDVKNDKAIRKFYSDIYPMITDTGEDKKIIIIGTSQREDDLYERLPEDFHAMTLQAILDEEAQQVLEPALFSWETLMKVKQDMSEKFGEKYWLKEYMNAPFEAMGEIIKPQWIQYYHELPAGLDIFTFWDLSVGKDMNKGDWTAKSTIGVRKKDGKLEIYVIDTYRERLDFGNRLKKVHEHGVKEKPRAIGVEENTFQYDTVNTLQKQTNLPIRGVKTIRNKTEKFQVELGPHFENKKVFIKSDMEELKKELLSLPYGKYDDLANSLTGAIMLSSDYSGEPIIDFI